MSCDPLVEKGFGFHLGIGSVHSFNQGVVGHEDQAGEHVVWDVVGDEVWVVIDVDLTDLDLITEVSCDGFEKRLDF